MVTTASHHATRPGRTPLRPARPPLKPARPPIKVIAQDRAYDALVLRRAGVEWPQVAARVGYADGRIAHLAVNAFLQKAALEQAPQHRQAALELEVERLDAMQASHWDAATNGHDHKAAHLVLKIIMQRCALLGLDHPLENAGPRFQSIVIGGTTQEYIAGLKAVCEDTDDRRR